MPFSDRIKEVEESKSVRMAGLVAHLRSEGKQIIGLNVGEPDFPTPGPIIEATQKALAENKTRYHLVPGLVELREAICKKLSKENQIQAKKENILISNGSKQIIYSLFQVLLNQDDEVLIPVPYWVTFPEAVKLAGGVPVFVDCKNLQLDLEKIEAAITPKTKAIIFNTPNNPSGAVYPKEDLLKLAQLALKNDIVLISDEAYEGLVYDGVEHFSVASHSKEIFENTITVQTFSKSYCMTGFRIGYMVAPAKFTAAVAKLQSHVHGNNCTFAQYGALAALEMDQKVFKEMAISFERRRDLCHKLFSQLFACDKPQGAFYLFPNIEDRLGDKFKSCEDFAEFILEKAHVAILPGTFFGHPGHLRISYAYSDEEIIEAHRRIAEIL
ncbi:MAG: pyridoxal phosphate-dependent aminotransferase [Halobacteriovoraceae bacterium]|jgi:aspartate aminotransferase|nr:pyridoxal phosphate-dependent aminotransferase [Halobacteriovoraceae bacterium]